MDLFDNTVLCKECNVRMSKGESVRNGFLLRFLECPRCKQKTYHPQDIAEYKNFSQLKSKMFKVKLRIVGNSHAVSIPKDILDFFNHTEEMAERMVTVALEEFNKVSLMFDEMHNGREGSDSDDDNDLRPGKGLIKRKPHLKRLQ